MSPVDWLPDGFTVQRIAANNTQLSVAVGGTGPVLVLLHGWPQTSRAWARVLPALTRRHTVVVPDLRGTGASDRPEDGYKKTNQADDLRGVLTALDLGGPVAVAGHDIGLAHSGTTAARTLRPCGRGAGVREAFAPTGHFVAEEDPDWLVATLDGFLTSTQD